jgi:cytochrome d ubiquinol oxidase subunit II
VSPELAIAGVMLAALVIYTLSAGADFGGGAWLVFASGPRADDQRDLVDDAIGPIWEANHVWLILVVVLLFVCFPLAYAAISTALHIPLTVMLIGVVLRGSAFAFVHAYTHAEHHDPAPRRWARVFAVASLITPVTLGVTLGALSTGLELDPNTGRVRTDFFSEWLAPFPFAVGLFALLLFAYLAAVYLADEARRDPELSDMFRRRALISAVLVAGAALLTFLVAPARLQAGLADTPWALALHLATGLAALAAIVLLVRRRLRAARLAAMLQVALIVIGWALAQHPHLAWPHLTITGAAAPRSVLVPVLIALGLGALLLIPALAYLFVVFKGRVRPGNQATTKT